MDFKLLFSFILLLCCFQDILTIVVTNDCGNLSMAEPAILNGNVSFAFVPSYPPEQNESVVWYKRPLRSDDTKLNDLDTAKYYTYRTDSTFHMVIINASSNEDGEEYYLYCRNCSSPIIQLYLNVPPTMPNLYIEDFKEGSLVNISCISTGARPAPKMKIFISNTEINSTETITHEKLTDTFTTMMVLDNMKREWNGLGVKCCISHVTSQKDICTSEKVMTYIYPPVDVRIDPPEPILEDHPYHMINVVCYVVDANPVCGVVWNVSDKLVVGRSNETHVETWNNGFSTVSSVILNVSKADIGTEITCMADCAKFPSEKAGLYVIQVPYASLIAINVSSVVDVAKGETFNVKCSAESIPKSTIKWMYKDKETAVPNNQIGPACDVHSACLRIESSTTDNSGLYTCIANNEVFGLSAASVTINVIDVDPEVDTRSKMTTNASVWAVTGTLAFLCILAVAVAVVVIRKRNLRVNSCRSGQTDVQKNRPDAGQEPCNDTDPVVYYNTVNSSELSTQNMSHTNRGAATDEYETIDPVSYDNTVNARDLSPHYMSLTNTGAATSEYESLQPIEPEEERPSSKIYENLKS